MKKFHRILVLLLLVLFFPLCACSDENAVFSSSKKYKVLFEKNPKITNETVLSKGLPIGKVLSKDIDSKNLVVISISIDKDKTSLMKNSTVFYLAEGALNYEVMTDEADTPLPENAKILGFPSKTSLVMFQARAKTRKIAGTVKNKAGEWYELSVQKSNEWYRKATE